MSSPVAPQFPPVPIGEQANPAAVLTPHPDQLFSKRAERFRALAADHQLGDYLRFLGGIADAQAAILPNLPPVRMVDHDQVERAFSFGMPPLQRQSIALDDALLTTLERLMQALKPLAMPEAARAALDGLSAADEGERRTMLLNVLDDALPFDEIAEHVFVAAAVQVHMARLAATLDPKRMTSAADGACPACGGPPVSSSVAGSRTTQSERFVACSCCSTQWHVVRVKCVACSSTKGIHYQHPQGTAETVKAECCDTCMTYLKILAVNLDPDVDAVADDVASAGLDLLVKELGYRRGGFNPFLAGF